MKPQNLNVVMAQMQSLDDVAVNQKHILKVLETYQNKKVDLFCFPENSLYLGIDKTKKFEGLELSDPFFRTLSEQAQKLKSHILISFAVKTGKKMANAVVHIKPDSIKMEYEKIHLFDVQVAGHVAIRESDTYIPGTQPKIVDIEGWKVGLSICYDMRFAELYSYYARQAVDMIIAPSAFLVPTGKAHWHVLLRARAIESQCYVLAPAQAGKHKSDSGVERFTYGHSLAVSPWGEVLAEGNENGAENIEVLLDYQKIINVREQIPMSRHRKL